VRLRQETLAAQFGVSRTPVREALRKLEARGIVELEPHRGALVRGPTAREIRDAYEVRAELEGLAAELATARIRDRELHALREAEAMFRHTIAELLDGRRRAKTAPASAPSDGEWSRANDLFHRAIQDAAGNRRLVEVVEHLHRSFPRDLTWAALADSSVLLEQNVDEHHRILEAIERGDAEEARRQMIDHVRGAGELIARRFEQLESGVQSSGSG
jgi:DNA-binding GntR family transcriptional regulator